MIKKILFKKLFSAASIFSILLNILLPLFSGQLVYAQEVTPTPSVEALPAPTADISPSPSADPQPSPTVSPSPEVASDVAPVPSPTATPVPSPVPDSSPTPTPTPAPAPELTPSPEVTPSASVAPAAAEIWQDSGDGKWETINNVETGKEYTARQNDKVKVKFTGISGEAGKLSIKEVKLTADQVSQTGALSDTAYEITSTMADGTFFYNLTLPLPPEASGKEIEVEAAESLDQLNQSQTVSEPKEETPDTITILGLNHFTVFIITTPSPDTPQPVLINEILPNPSAGAEWVELYNNSPDSVDLAAGTGWTIQNSAGDTQNLGALGIIPVGGRAVFEAPLNWLSNVGSETITLSDGTGADIDTVTISLTSPGFAINHYPAAGESVGRRVDASTEWIIFKVPTKGSPNVLAAPAARAVASTIEAHGYPTWYSDDNGTRVAACLDGSDPRCALAGEAGFDPAQPSLIPNFPSEFFYWSAEALMDTPGGRARLVLADEGAFMTVDGSPAEGQQMVFGRIRVRADGLTPNTDYTVTHPYGSVVIRTDGTGNLRSDNDDIGCEVAPCDFAAALASPVFESFIRWDSGAPAGYLGDGVTEHTVTGSPTGNNFFRIEGPGLPAGGIETNLFAVLGKLFVDPVTPPPGCINTVPDAPTLALPADGATGVAVSPTLSWNAIANFGVNCLGNTNQFEIFLDAGNVDPTTSFGSVSEATLSKLVIGLTANTTFSWKVRAKNGALFTDSAVQTFTTTVAVGGRAVSPNFEPDSGFPAWYRDDAGIMVVPCLDGADPNCAAVLPPLGEEPTWNPNLPTDFPDSVGATFNFPSEFFYWTGEAAIEQGGVSLLLILAAEGAFLNESPAPADQMVFGRIRVRGDGLLPNTEYTVTHPYGQDVYTTNEFGALRPSPNTEDIGCAASLCDFSLALNSRIFGGFLRQTTAPEGYLGDGLTFAPVVGSPLGQNFFRIEGPGLPDGGLQTNLFATSGKVLLATPPPPEGCVDSAPDQPQLASPGSGATEVSTNPLVSWNALASFGTNCLGGRDQFEIFLDEGVVTDPLTSRGTVLGTETSFTVLNLLPNTTYSWKVRASNNALSTDSVVRTFTTTASTANRAVSLATTNNGFPDWYRDDLGIAVVPCWDGADPNCVLPGPGEEPGFDPAQPPVLPGNFPSEFFYWIAESNPLATPGGGDVDIRYAVEGAFLSPDPSAGNQLVFGRIRVRATGLLPNAIYTATHAYGVDIYETDANGNITSVLGTEDVGCDAVPCDFILPLNSRVFGGFLRMVAGAPVGYLGDGATVGEVTGSPLGQNFFRIEGPGLPAGGLQTNLFSVSGKLLSVVPPGPDVTAPNLTSFTSTTADGTYGPGSEINITANFNEPLAAGSTAIVVLNNTVPIELVQLSLSSTTLVGTYTVGALGSGQDSADLTVASISFMDVTDPAGNLQTSTLLPASNIADTSDIVINTTTVVPPPATTGTITVIKDAVPDDVQDFGFRMRNGPFDESFTLDDDGDNANELSNNVLFADLAPGVYDLQEDGVGNWTLAELTCVNDLDSGTTIDLNARSAAIDLDGGESITCTFTNAQRNTISGMKFRDLNGNGIKEAGEAGLSGWTIFLDENDNVVLEGGEPSAVTDAAGNYQFIDVAGGTQNVREVRQDGWTQTAPAGGKYTLVVANNSFINQDFGNILTTEIFGGSFGLAGDDANSTTQAVALEDVTVETPTNGGTTTITIPSGTVITRSDGGVFDPDLLATADADEGLLSGFASGVVADRALQFGLPAVGLAFSQPIIINFFVGTAFNGQTLNIQRSVSGTSAWTSDGIVAPATCTVSAGICSFQATLASFYAATHTESISTPTPTPAPAPASGGGGGGGGDGSSTQAPTCNDPAAGGASTLLSATATGANQVTLTWSKAADPVTHYVISYGLTPGNPLFGNPNVGGKDTTSYTVKDLSGGTTYYFRVRAANGCNGGAYSNEIAATPGGGVVTGPASGFTAGVLGAQVGGALGDENTGTGTGGSSVEESPSPSPEVLGDGNVGIGLGQQAGIGGQSFLGFMQTQTSLLGILAGLVLLFVLNIFYRRT